jgi:TPR repeat protein
MNLEPFSGWTVWALLSLAMPAVSSAQTETGESAAVLVESPYGIPGQVPVDEVWSRFLATSNVDKASVAMQVVNELFDDEGNLDQAVCSSQAQAVREALAEIPISVSLWLYGGRCAELAGDRALAEQSEVVLAALLEHAMGEPEWSRHERPIRVLSENDVYAIVELSGESMLYHFYEVPVTGRHMRLTVALYDEHAQLESSMHFDFLDVFVQLLRDVPDMEYPDGRRKFARSLVEQIEASEGAETAHEGWAALEMTDPAARAAKLIELGRKEGQHGLWVGLMCVMIKDLQCAAEGIDMLLPYAEAEYADAYMALAFAYAHGHGVEQDDDAAREMLAAANQEVGAPRAEIGLQTALAHLTGKSTLHPLVADALREAAHQGNPTANLLVAQDDASAGQKVPMLELASAAGIAEATGLLGAHYIDAGETERGARLLDEAANGGSVKAAKRLGTDCLLGRLDGEHCTKSLHWLKVAAQEGDTQAMRLLGLEFRRLGGADNHHRADRWFSNALLRGDLRAALLLAEFLSEEPEGTGDPRRRALILYNALIDEHDSVEARVQLGSWYMRPDNPDRSLEKAEALLRVAAERGDSEGRVRYVVSTVLGRLPGGDLKQSRTWLEEGVEGADVETGIGYASAMLYAQNEFADIPRALAALSRWWEEQQNPSALNELAWARCTSSNAAIFSAELSPVLGAALAELEATQSEPAWLDTVAACHAAAGNFEQAIEVQQGALEQTEKALGVDHPMAEGMRARLAQFHAGERVMEEAPYPEDNDEG